MVIEYSQLKYSDEQKKYFPSDLEGKPVMIALDSIKINGTHGKVYKDSEDALKDYLLREFDSKEHGTYYNWFITRDGRLYHITPNGKAGHSCVFALYSTRMSMTLPGVCPQHKVDVKDMSNVPDKYIISICTELSSDNNDVPLTSSQEFTLRNLIAYHIKALNIKPSDVISRSDLTRNAVEKELLGHKAYANNLPALAILASYSLMITRNEQTISLNSIDDVKVN